MFSGKTTELIRRLNRYAFAQYRCLIIKYVNDTRYSNNYVATHDGVKIPAITLSNLYDIAPSIELYDVIGIDEGQFVSHKSLHVDVDEENFGISRIHVF